MKPTPPNSPHEELEARLTALLLGELPADEAAALRHQIAGDAGLARLHNRLQQTIALVREAATAPELQTASAPDAPTLAPERREQLLATFKVVPAKKLRRLRLPSVNWRNVKWREHAALAAMLMALLAVATVLMAPTLKSLKLMEEVGEADSEGLFAFFDRRKSPQRMTTMSGAGLGSVSDAEPAVDAATVVTVNGARASDFGLPAAAPAKGIKLSGPAPVAVDNFTTTITPGLPVRRSIALSFESAPATEPNDTAPALKLPTGGQAPPSVPFTARLFSATAAPAPADPRSGRDVTGQPEFDSSTVKSFSRRLQVRTPSASDGRTPDSASTKHLGTIVLPALGDADQSGRAVPANRDRFDTLASGVANQSGAAGAVNGRELERLGDQTEAAQNNLRSYHFELSGPAGAGTHGGGGGAGGGSQSRFSGASAASALGLQADKKVESPRLGNAPKGVGAWDWNESEFAPASALDGTRNVPARPVPQIATVEGFKASDSKLDGKAAAGVDYFFTTPIPAKPAPIILADAGADARFVNEGRIENGIMEKRLAGGRFTTGGVENRGTDESGVTVIRRRVDSLAEAVAAGEPVSLFVNGGENARPTLLLTDPTPAAAPPPAPVAVEAKLAAIEDDVKLNIANYAWSIASTNSFASGLKPATAGKGFDHASPNDWFGTTAPDAGLRDNDATQKREGLSLGGRGAVTLSDGIAAPANRSTFVGRLNQAVSRAASSPAALGQANNPVPAGAPPAQGVHGVDAVGFGNVSLNAQNLQTLESAAQPLDESLKHIEVESLAAKPDTARHFYRTQLDAASGSDAKELRAEMKKVAGVSKKQSDDFVAATGTVFFDLDAGLSPSESMRESARALSEKTAVTRLDGEQVARRQSRVKIALPEGEHGESLERQRVAVGPVVVSEVMYNELATGLPTQKNEFVELQDIATDALTSTFANRRGSGLSAQSDSREYATVRVDPTLPTSPKTGKSRTELTRKLNSIRLESVRYDDLPLRDVIEDLSKKARALDPAKKGVNLLVSGTVDPSAAPANIDPTTGLPAGGDQSGLGDLGATTIKIDPPIRNVTLGEALQIISKAADRPINFSFEDWGVLLTAGTNKLDSKVVKDETPVRQPPPSAPIPQPEVPTAENAFSTFSLNVSDVSFKLAAASLEKGQMPDPATVRSEEFINAFDYRDPEPAGSAPIAFAWERARYPFAHDRDLLRFSVKTAASGRQPGRPLNLVLLLDNSGSMERADRVRIRQECLRVLARQLRPEDRVSVVAFARTARLWVDGLPGSQAGELPQRVGTLAPEGGTNLEEAMNVAYQTALKHFLANGVNRVVLLTDGAANLGDVQPESLKKKVEAHRKQGVALDCFGIGWDGLNDELLEALSRNGDGRYGFVNTPEAATTEFASQLAGALKVAASDVKVQVEWNPRRVTAYRQIGYAKHQLKKEQFRDNTVDAAEIGAAEAGNALYTVQVNPRGEGPLGTVRVRFKVPGTSDYREHEWPLAYDGSAKSLDQSSPALRLAASASAFSEWLVSSPFAAEVTPDKLLGYLGGVPETWPADPRPKKLEWMIRQAKSVAGK